MTSDDEPSESTQGVFLTKGMRIDISEFSLQLNADGSVATSNLTLAVALDMSPYWLDIAITHGLAAKDASFETRDAHATDDAERKGLALQTEFCAGMQAIVACATAVDAL
ncbi:hypothetical protein [Thalassoroseus pseudoceratinae]|uniref:hypothetical protein n=1 Tax=Thalassoroseus pseudoceratinae TaxID=2713176 RepID=UPI001420CC4C|nr:hypothetical protein [Thalassoroseus pseudoceratinae]